MNGVVRSLGEQAFATWLTKVSSLDETWAVGPGGGAEARKQTADIHRALHALFTSPQYDDLSKPAFIELERLSVELFSWRAHKSGSVTEVVNYILALKTELEDLVTRHFVDMPTNLVQELMRIRTITERLLRSGVAAFVSARDDLISRQSRAILEISTPVIKVWDDVLLLPLVGVIDTPRAQQMIERLLEAISRYEAKVAILDITGVPMIDSRVARHLLVTVDATRMLGAETIITGISPDAAITLTSLGIDVSKVNTKGALRAGMVEAFRLTGDRFASVRICDESSDTSSR